jgi:hypothetical protein
LIALAAKYEIERGKAEAVVEELKAVIAAAKGETQAIQQGVDFETAKLEAQTLQDENARTFSDKKISLIQSLAEFEKQMASDTADQVLAVTTDNAEKQQSIQSHLAVQLAEIELATAKKVSREKFDLLAAESRAAIERFKEIVDAGLKQTAGLPITDTTKAVIAARAELNAAFEKIKAQATEQVVPSDEEITALLIRLHALQVEIGQGTDRDKKAFETIQTLIDKLSGSSVDVKTAFNAITTTTNALNLALNDSVQVLTAYFARLNQELARSLTLLDLQQQKLDTQKAAGKLTPQQFAQQSLDLASQRERQIQDRFDEVVALRDSKQAALDSFSGMGEDFDKTTNALALTNDQVHTLEQQLQAVKTVLADINLQLKAAPDNLELGFGVGVQRIADQAHGAGETLADVMDAAAQSVSNFAGEFVANMGDFIDGTKNAEEAFRQFAETFLKMIAKMIVQQIIFNAVAASSSSSTWGSGGGNPQPGSPSFIGPVMPASGGVINRYGRLDRYQSGGVARQPKKFEVGGIIRYGRHETADDVPIWVSKGEGIIRASSVRYYGENLIHALNRRLLTRDSLARLAAIAYSPSRSFTYATGGVVNNINQTNLAAAATSSQPIVLNNILAIGDSHIEQLGARAPFKNAVMTALREKPDVVRAIAGGGKGFSER